MPGERGEHEIDPRGVGKLGVQRLAADGEFRALGADQLVEQELGFELEIRGDIGHGLAQVALVNAAQPGAGAFLQAVQIPGLERDAAIGSGERVAIDLAACDLEARAVEIEAGEFIHELGDERLVVRDFFIDQRTDDGLARAERREREQAEGLRKKIGQFALKFVERVEVVLAQAEDHAHVALRVADDAGDELHEGLALAGLALEAGEKLLELVEHEDQRAARRRGLDDLARARLRVALRGRRGKLAVLHHGLGEVAEQRVQSADIDRAKILLPQQRNHPRAQQRSFPQPRARMHHDGPRIDDPRDELPRLALAPGKHPRILFDEEVQLLERRRRARAGGGVAHGIRRSMSRTTVLASSSMGRTPNCCQ